ncbi:MAG: D-amino-acid dehydrogenase, partial [Planctomycetota bacterium]
RLIASWSAVNAKWGVEVREETEVLGIHADPNRAGRASVVVTDKGELEADCVVVATGAMAPLLNKQLGCRLSVQPGKGYSITQPRPEACPNRPVIFAEHKVAATPFEDGYRLGSTMEFTGYDPRIRPARLELLRNADAVYMREASRGSGEEAWFGWRSMTSDGLPIIDRSPRFGNVIVATGHNMLGLTLAPVTGKLVADLAAERKPQLDLQPLRIDR